jgi:large subunit ribosomal protein L33
MGLSFCAHFSLLATGRSPSQQGGKSERGNNPRRKKGGAAKMRVKITLRCNECKQRNYNTVKNKKNDPDRLEMNKYCPFCRKHTVHSETK